MFGWMLIEKKEWDNNLEDRIMTRNQLVKKINYILELGIKIKKLEKVLMAESYHVEQKERTIKAKNNEIYFLRQQKCDLRQQLNEHIVIIKDMHNRFYVSELKYKDQLKHYRRKIKCLHDNVWACNAKIKKLKSEGELGGLTEENRILHNKLSECKGDLYTKIRKLETTKKTIARLMEGK